jgi:carboxymethylenebutenolidase
MVEREIRIETADGSMRASVTHPDGDGPFPLVLMLMDAPGYRDALKQALGRFASAGYYGVLPDLYYRAGDIAFDPADLAADTSGELRKQMFGLMGQISDDMSMSDVSAVLAHADSEDAACTPGGCVGYCWGGRLVVRAMAAFPDVFAAGASIHPARVVTDQPDSSHNDIHKIRGEIYFGCGEQDGLTPPEVIETLRETIDASGVRGEIEIYPGADHGFAVAGGRAYRPEAAERHFERTLDVFRRNLSEPAVRC